MAPIVSILFFEFNEARFAGNKLTICAIQRLIGKIIARIALVIFP